VDYESALALLERLGRFLDQFVGCFGRRAQREGAGRYVRGLLNDSERKSIQALHGRLSDAGSYQGLQHFITHSPWDASRVWRQLRSALPVRRGLLLIDETSFPKQGEHSVAVGRQYCGALGKIANCQVAVTTALVAEGLSWPTTIELFVPHAWIDSPSRRDAAGIPATVRYQEKWRIALRHVRQVRASGVAIDAVLGDAEYGKVPTFRRTLERMGLRYALGVPACFPVWTRGARRSRTIGDVAARLPARQWRRVCWGEGTKGPLAARFAVMRVRPTQSRRECWLLCERTLTADEDRKYYFVQAPVTWSLKQVVALAHARWKIEQHYQELKGELGLDHFEGRSWRGWHHHAVLAALTYTFLQHERRRGTDPLPTFPAIRNLVREIVAALFFVTQPKWLNLVVSFQRNPPLRI
jgi:SRSO17 transposase